MQTQESIGPTGRAQTVTVSYRREAPLRGTLEHCITTVQRSSLTTGSLSVTWRSLIGETIVTNIQHRDWECRGIVSQEQPQLLSPRQEGSRYRGH
ncbi:hypothetical protein EYF80_044581 [Liparis tanakae]|uniref:Uncharacterized protein n=1 Tax=Liparis tanakae TaxID=230148 RepID=A0A4Z2FVG5_9TELE|nr:hypothetical protein EYF80_044581 [Liparis tanakae]